MLSSSMLLAWESPKSWAVPWDVSLVFQAITGLREQIGIAFNVGIWIFIGITGILLVFKFLDGLVH